MLGLSLSLASNATQRILSQANNISYAVRDSYRMGTVPENRKADYMFRHFYMVPVCGILTELGFRVAEVAFSLPLMTRTLGLTKLVETYGPNSKDVIGQFKHLDPKDFPKIQSLQDVPFLKSRISGSLARESSTVLIPGLVKDVDLPKLAAEGASQSQNYEVLVHHLTRLMNFDTPGGFLDQMVEANRLSAEEAKLVKTGLKDIQGVKSTADKLLKILQDGVQPKHQLVEEEAKVIQSALGYLERFMPEAHQELAGVSPRLQNYLNAGLTLSGEELTKLKDGLVKLSHPETGMAEMLKNSTDKIKTLIQEGLANGLKVAELKMIQKSSFWPKMIATTALNFVLYGVLQSWLDVNFIQPWQKKLFAKRGTTSEVVTPVYWGLIPFGATLVALMNDKLTPKLIQRMGHLGRFAVAGTAALAAYTGTAAAIIAYRLSKPPKNPSQSQPEFNGSAQLNPALMGLSLEGLPLQRPQGFQAFNRAFR